MEALDYWKLCDEVSVFQAIFLCLSKDPKNYSSYDIEQEESNQPDGYGAIKKALSTALQKGQIEGVHIPHIQYDDEGIPRGDIVGSVNLDESTVKLNSVRFC